MSGHIIILEGLPGVGKTLLCESIAKHVDNVVILKEWVDEDILEKYIKNMKMYASRFQFRIQNETMSRMRKAVDHAKAGYIVVVDRGIAGNRCFAEMQHQAGLISASDIEIYRRSFNYEMIEGLNDVDFTTIYMKANVSICLEHIKKRDRKGEDSYNEIYLNRLKTMHDIILSNAKIVNWNVNHNLEEDRLPQKIVENILTIL